MQSDVNESDIKTIRKTLLFWVWVNEKERVQHQYKFGSKFRDPKTSLLSNEIIYALSLMNKNIFDFNQIYL